MTGTVVLQVGPLMRPLGELLRAAYDVVELPCAQGERDRLLAERGADVRAAVTAVGAPVDAELIAALPRLGVVANMGVGYDNVDTAAAERHGVVVSNTPGVLNDSVGEMAVALALDVLRRVSAADRYVRAGRWGAEGWYPVTRQLSGRRVGILGLGRIGRVVADRFAAFGCPVAYHNRSRAEVPYEYVGTPVSLAAWADVLVVVVPGTPATERMVDRTVLEALGPDGVLVNVARGSVVDQEALVGLLLDGALGGAGLDVFTDEPHVPEELMALDTVVLQPHAASATEEARRAMAELVLANLDRYFSQGSLVTPVP